MASTDEHSTMSWGGPASPAQDQRTDEGWARPQPTADINVVETIPLVPPKRVCADVPLSDRARRCVLAGREAVQQILSGMDRRLLAVVGPCSIHDEAAAIDYAQRLTALSRQVADVFCVIMRVYFEKPRTTIGWKGLIYDPYLDGSFAMEEGIRMARRLLLQITEMGLPAATEMLDPIVPQYIADLVTWASIGARTTESQTHRQMASGLSMPVGFKNSTEGNLQVAVDAMQSARHPHSFLGIDEEGKTAIIRTRGNRWGHLILRGGRSGPNYDPATIAQAAAALRKAGLPAVIMIDCSHANSNKQFRNQEIVWNSVIEQYLAGTPALIGLMLESNLHEGSQPFTGDRSRLRYGVSLTDECVGWEKTSELLLGAADRLRSAGRSAPAT